MDNSIGNQLKSQSLDDVLSSAFKQVGGRVFPDLSATKPLLDLVAIVNAYQATHMVAYGNPIPDTGAGYSTTLSGDGLNTVIAPLNNQCVRLNALSVTNGGGAAPIVVNILLGDTLVVNVTAGPNEIIAVPLTSIPFTLSKGQTLTAIKISGTAADITVNASTVLTCL